MALPCVCPRAGCLSAPALLAYIAVMLLASLPQMPSCWQSASGTLLKLMLHLLLWPRTLRQALLVTGNVTKFLISDQYQCKTCVVANSMLPAHGFKETCRIPQASWIIERTFGHRLSQDVAICKEPAASRSLSMTLHRSRMCSKSVWRTRSTCP